MGKSATVIFGRFNPPTTGHEKLVNRAQEIAKQNNSDLLIFPSQSFDSSKNPLPFNDKLKFMKKSFPKLSKSIMDSKKMGIRHAFDVIEFVQSRGYTTMNFIVGSDRVAEFQKMSRSIKDPEFKYIVLSAGERDPDADDVSGMSASKMRNFVSEDDFASFNNGTTKSLNTKDAQAMFDTVKANLKESIEVGENLEEKLFEVLTPAQRMKRSRAMKKIQGKIQAKRKIAMKKRSTPEKIEQKARKEAIKILKKKFARGKDVEELSLGQKAAIEKKIVSKKGLVDRLAKKFIKVIRKREQERLSGGTNE